MPTPHREPINHASNPNCPACIAGRWHQPEEWKQYHPDAGHGYTREAGWTKPELNRQVRERSSDPGEHEPPAKNPDAVYMRLPRDQQSDLEK